MFDQLNNMNSEKSFEVQFNGASNTSNNDTRVDSIPAGEVNNVLGITGIVNGNRNANGNTVELSKAAVQQQQEVSKLAAVNAAAARIATFPALPAPGNHFEHYASLRSLNARDLKGMQQKLDSLNSPTINAASALLSAAAPPSISMPAPLVPPQKYGVASLTSRVPHPDEKKRIPHVYHDYAQIPDRKYVRRKMGGVSQPFPEKLMVMLNKEGEAGHGDIVEWLPHGRAFIVRKPREFTEVIMPKYFRQTKITSFQRQLNLYGFRRITQGPDSGAYYHELFLRGRPNLCARMVRTKVKGTGHKQASDATSEPNFYAMPAQPAAPNTEESTQGGPTEVIRNGVSTGPAVKNVNSVSQMYMNQIAFSPHLHGAANLLTGIAQGHAAIPDLNLNSQVNTASQLINHPTIKGVSTTVTSNSNQNKTKLPNANNAVQYNAPSEGEEGDSVTPKVENSGTQSEGIKNSVVLSAFQQKLSNGQKQETKSKVYEC
mmetsp:Transcript_14664/g.19140  ORF Transcript_14664/g.19140 Transcript_14664/m.19140 type:complete len:487 (-) Transcript_14664:371-1831(-)